MALEAKLSNEETAPDVSSLPTIHEQLQKMESQITKVKALLQKTKEIKQELKVEILTADEDIDKYVHNIGALIDTLDGSYEAKVKFLNA